MLPRLPVWGESSEAPASPEVSEETKQSIHQNSELRETHQSLTGCDVTPPVTVIRQKIETSGERDNSYDTDDLIRLQRETNRTSSCHVMSSLIRTLFVFQFRSERSEDATQSRRSDWNSSWTKRCSWGQSLQLVFCAKLHSNVYLEQIWSSTVWVKLRISLKSFEDKILLVCFPVSAQTHQTDTRELAGHLTVSLLCEILQVQKDGEKKTRFVFKRLKLDLIADHSELAAPELRHSLHL